MLVALHPPDEISTSEYPRQAPREAPQSEPGHHIEKKSTLGHALFLPTRCSDAGAMLPKQRPIELADAQASGAVEEEALVVGVQGGQTWMTCLSLALCILRVMGWLTANLQRRETGTWRGQSANVQKEDQHLKGGGIGMYRGLYMGLLFGFLAGVTAGSSSILPDHEG